MESIGFKAFETALKSHCSEFAAKTFPEEVYTLESIRLVLNPSPSLPAAVFIRMSMAYRNGNKPTINEYEYQYYIHSNGMVSSNRIPLSLGHYNVHMANSLMRQAVEAWAQDVKTYFSLPARKARFAPIHEELAAKMWHPDRVADLLEKGGWEAVY